MRENVWEEYQEQPIHPCAWYNASKIMKDTGGRRQYSQAAQEHCKHTKVMGKFFCCKLNQYGDCDIQNSRITH